MLCLVTWTFIILVNFQHWCLEAKRAHRNLCQPVPDPDQSMCQGLCQMCEPIPSRWRDSRESNVPLNVAQNMPSFVSSSWSCLGHPVERECSCSKAHSLQACGANNGLRGFQLSTGCGNLPYNCIHTDSLTGNNAEWWYVDLQRPVTVMVITVTGRGSASASEQDFTWRRMCCMILLVDAGICAEAKSITALHKNFGKMGRAEWPIRFFYFCEKPPRGQYVRFQKLPNADDPVLHFCEVEVYACPSGMFSKLPWMARKNARLTCLRCTCKHYPCDNVFGCYTEKDASSMATNLAMGKLIRVFNQRRSNPGIFLNDGVTQPRDFRCYMSDFGELVEGQSQHFIRVYLDGLYQIRMAKVVNMAGAESLWIGFEVRTGQVETDVARKRMPGDGLCWRKEGVFGAVHAQACVSCSTNDCPIATFVTFLESSEERYLKLCETLVFGFPVKVLSQGSPCGTCKLEVCDAGLLCVDKFCRTEIGKTCSADRDCNENGRCHGRTCKLPLGGNCAGKRSALCGMGLECKSDVCLLVPGEGPCSSNNDCSFDGVNEHQRLFCDYTKKCRRRLGSSCISDDVCVAGAFCKYQADGRRLCTCYSNTSEEWDPSSPIHFGKCRPILHNKSCRKDKDVASQCQQPAEAMTGKLICRKSKCACDAHLTLSDRDLTCRKDVGQLCTADEEGTCSFGMECQESVCRRQVNTPCNGEGECMRHAVCDNSAKRCLYAAGQDCPSQDYCQTGTLCQSGKCRHLRGEMCNSSSKSACVQGLVCNVPATANASDTQRRCILALGGVCVNDGECSKGSVCNTLINGTKQCRNDALQPCEHNWDCREHSDCSPDKKCRWKTSSSCHGSDTCLANAICDVDRRCRLKKGENCTDFPYHCRIRTVCHNDTKTCKCADKSVSHDDHYCSIAYHQGTLPSLVSSLCQPEENKTQCSEAGVHAYCDVGMRMCACMGEYEPNVRLKCQPGVGAPCNLPTQANCLERLVCENHLCHLRLGQPCLGRERQYCPSGTTCDTDDRCRLLVEADCPDEYSNQFCKLGSTCDQYKHCKYPAGYEGCVSSLSCVGGAKCVKDLSSGKYACTCHTYIAESKPTSKGWCSVKPGYANAACYAGTNCIDPNAVCVNEQKCMCKPGFEVSYQDLSCKVAEGFPCTDTKDCVPGKACDVEERTCRRALGSWCTTSSTDPKRCESRMICQKGICRIPEGGSCVSEDKRIHCQPGTVCDVMGFCKRGLSYPCNITAECGAGMLCLDNACVCNKHATSLSVGWCQPKAGYVGAVCSSSFQKKCTVPESYCDEVTFSCKCKNSAHVSLHDLVCIMAEASKHQLSEDKLKIVISIIGIMLVVTVAVAVSCRARGAEQKEAIEEKMLARQRLMKVFGAEVTEFESPQNFKNGGIKAATKDVMEKPLLQLEIPLVPTTNQTSTASGYFEGAGHPEGPAVEVPSHTDSTSALQDLHQPTENQVVVAATENNTPLSDATSTVETPISDASQVEAQVTRTPSNSETQVLNPQTDNKINDA